MKIYRMIGSLFLFLEVAFCGWAEVKGTQDISFIYYHVEGNIDNSFHPKNDHNYLYEGTVDYTLPVLGAEEFYGSISYRSTNDRTVDTEDFSIEKLYTGIKGNNFDFLVGDYYAEFSDYSLNNALKGVKLDLGSEEAYKLVVLAGVDIAKWTRNLNLILKWDTVLPILTSVPIPLKPKRIMPICWRQIMKQPPAP